MKVRKPESERGLTSFQSAGGYLPRPKRSLGQNFLVDQNIARKIVEELRLSKASQVVEIGPGRGALTRLIAESGATLEAVEKDDDLFSSLRSRLAEYPRVSLIHCDFLSYEIPETTYRQRVIGNIPYNLTSRIVSKLVDDRSKIDFAIVMVQDEVAQRLAAKSGTKQYGAISVRLQLVAEVEKLFRVSPNCFRPKPNVESSVIRIAFRNRNPLENEGEFVSFVKAAFSTRRKMFRYFVAHRFGKGSLARIDESFLTRRVETFSPSDIYSLFLTLIEND